MTEPDKPIEGFYEMRLVRGGPWCPVRIWHGMPFDPATGEWCERQEKWRACLNGEQVDVWRCWPGCSGHPISEADYRHMRAAQNYAVTFEADLPAANPHRKIDLDTLPPIYKRIR